MIYSFLSTSTILPLSLSVSQPRPHLCSLIFIRLSSSTLPSSISPPVSISLPLSVSISSSTSFIISSSFISTCLYRYLHLSSFIPVYLSISTSLLSSSPSISQNQSFLSPSVSSALLQSHSPAQPQVLPSYLFNSTSVTLFPSPFVSKKSTLTSISHFNLHPHLCFRLHPPFLILTSPPSYMDLSLSIMSPYFHPWSLIFSVYLLYPALGLHFSSHFVSFNPPPYQHL